MDIEWYESEIEHILSEDRKINKRASREEKRYIFRSEKNNDQKTKKRIERRFAREMDRFLKDERILRNKRKELANSILKEFSPKLKEFSPNKKYYNKDSKFVFRIYSGIVVLADGSFL